MYYVNKYTNSSSTFAAHIANSIKNKQIMLQDSSGWKFTISCASGDNNPQRNEPWGKIPRGSQVFHGWSGVKAFWARRSQRYDIWEEY